MLSIPPITGTNQRVLIQFWEAASLKNHKKKQREQQHLRFWGYWSENIHLLKISLVSVVAIELSGERSNWRRWRWRWRWQPHSAARTWHEWASLLLTLKAWSVMLCVTSAHRRRQRRLFARRVHVRLMTRLKIATPRTLTNDTVWTISTTPRRKSACFH